MSARREFTVVWHWRHDEDESGNAWPPKHDKVETTNADRAISKVKKIIAEEYLFETKDFVVDGVLRKGLDYQ